MAEASAYMSADDLIDGGIIQEANRRFFHILGFELVAPLEADGALSLKVREERGVKGGLTFQHREPEWSTVRQSRAREVDNMFSRAMEARIERYGFGMQPIDDL